MVELHSAEGPRTCSSTSNPWALQKGKPKSLLVVRIHTESCSLIGVPVTMNLGHLPDTVHDIVNHCCPLASVSPREEMALSVSFSIYTPLCWPLARGTPYHGKKAISWCVPPEVIVTGAQELNCSKTICLTGRHSKNSSAEKRAGIIKGQILFHLYFISSFFFFLLLCPPCPTLSSSRKNSTGQKFKLNGCVGQHLFKIKYTQKILVIPCSCWSPCFSILLLTSLMQNADRAAA